MMWRRRHWADEHGLAAGVAAVLTIPLLAALAATGLYVAQVVTTAEAAAVLASQTAGDVAAALAAAGFGSSTTAATPAPAVAARLGGQLVPIDTLATTIATTLAQGRWSAGDAVSCLPITTGLTTSIACTVHLVDDPISATRTAVASVAPAT